MKVRHKEGTGIAVALAQGSKPRVQASRQSPRLETVLSVMLSKIAIKARNDYHRIRVKFTENQSNQFGDILRDYFNLISKVY